MVFANAVAVLPGPRVAEVDPTDTTKPLSVRAKHLRDRSGAPKWWRSVIGDDFDYRVSTSHWGILLSYTMWATDLTLSKNVGSSCNAAIESMDANDWGILFRANLLSAREREKRMCIKMGTIRVTQLLADQYFNYYGNMSRGSVVAEAISQFTVEELRQLGPTAPRLLTLMLHLIEDKHIRSNIDAVGILNNIHTAIEQAGAVAAGYTVAESARSRVLGEEGVPYAIARYYLALGGGTAQAVLRVAKDAEWPLAKALGTPPPLAQSG